MADPERVPEATRARLRLGWRLGVGAFVLVAAAWLFGAIAEDVVTSDRLTVVDATVAEWLHRHATPALTRAMTVWTNLHSTIAVGAYTAAVALALAVERKWRRLMLVVVAVGGGLAVNALMKLAFHRARPVFDEPLLTLSSYSFPSGHVAGSTIFYGLTVLWLFSRTRRPLWRGLALATAVLMIVVVAFSRMYLGVHYLSDVVAAFAEGVAWLAICIGALAAFWRETPPEAALEAETP
ncbi:MAG TPA: phosphatase PAP2 family protein [Caldimonas sp.]|jgi:undecaprenyl-diphosphatase